MPKVKQYDKYPKEWCNLSDCKKKAEDKKGIQKVQDKINERSKKKDHLLAKKAYTYLFDRGSHVAIPNRQNYILTGSPHGSKMIGSFYDELIKRNVQVILTANQANESSSCPEFWSNKELKHVKLKGDWQIENVENRTKIHAKGKGDSKIVERILHLKKGKETREITHLHYEKWKDKNPAPDTELLHALLDRKDELHKSKNVPVDVPFVVNCKAGKGRTGTLAILDYARKEVDAQVAKGKKLNEVSLNIPEMIYEMRKQRPSLLGRTSQVQQVYQALGLYHDRLKAKHK